MLELAGITARIAAQQPERTCIVWRGRHVSWQELEDRTRRLGNLLFGHGLGVHGEPDPEQPWVSPHDHVGLYMLNGPEYLEAFLGSHKARTAPFNVNHKYVDRELSYLFGDARPKAIVFHARFAEALAAARRKLPPDVLLLQVDDGLGVPLLPGALDYEAALAASSAEPVPVEPSGNDLHLLYTGGTTGMPKGVLWRLADWLAGPLGVLGQGGGPTESVEEAAAAALAGHGRISPIPPMMHGSGTWSAVSGLCRGRTIVIQDVVERFDPDDVLDVCEREQVSSAMIIGDAFARPIVEALDRRPRDLAALRTILNSGAAVHPSVRARLAELLPLTRLVDTIGASESGPQAIRRDDADGWFDMTANASVLVANRSRVLGDKEPGEGWLAQSGRTPLAYLNDPAKTAQTFPLVDGCRFVVPGDRVVKADDRRIRFLGRESTTINTGGEKVFAEEVEEVVRGLAEVVDAVVVGRPSERWGSEVTAVIELERGANPSDDDLRRACAAKLANYKVPKAFIRVPRVQRLPNGKPDTAWARQTAANG